MINKLDLLGKGWNTSEIERASRILDEAEEKRHPKVGLFNRLLIVALIVLMLVNGFICSIVLVPFIYAITTSFIVVIAALIGFIFGVLFSILIFDIEKIHSKQEANLFVVLVANGLVGFYLIVKFSQEFGIKSGLQPNNNLYIIGAAYVLAFIAPHIVYEVRKHYGQSIR